MTLGFTGKPQGYPNHLLVLTSETSSCGHMLYMYTIFAPVEVEFVYSC